MILHYLWRSDNLRFTAAIIGLGNIAWKYDHNVCYSHSSALTHLSAYKLNPDIEVVAGFDPDVSQRREFTENTGIATTDTVEALVDMKPDIVSICSPHQYHVHQVIQCIEAGTKMIWLEKPATSDGEETRRIVDLLASKNYGTRIAVGFQRRYLPVYQNIKRAIEQSTYGTIRSINLTYSRGLEINGSHLLDVLFYLLGDRADYEIRSGTPVSKESNASFILAVGDVECVVTGVAVDYHSIDVSVHFEHARLSVLHGGLTEVIEHKLPNDLFPGFFRLGSVQSDARPALQCSEEMKLAFSYLLDDLIESYSDKRQPVSNLESSLHCQNLLDQLTLG